MKNHCSIAFLLLLPALAGAQLNNIDSLKTAFINAPEGKQKYQAASHLYLYYQESNRDSALFYTEQQLQIARREQHKIGEGIALGSKAYQLTAMGKYGDALKCLQQAFAIAEDKNIEKEAPWDYFITPFRGNGRLLLSSYAHHMYALLMMNTENTDEQIIHFKIAGETGKEINYFPRIMLAYMNLGQSYLLAGKADSALYYEKQAERSVQESSARSYFASKTYLGTIELILGDIYKALGNDSLSLCYYYKSLRSNIEFNNRISLSRVYLRLSKYHLEKSDKDSAIHYSLKNLAILKTMGMVTGAETNPGVGYENVYRAYQLNNQFDSAFKYQGMALHAKDSLSKIKIKNLAEFQKLTFGEQLRLQALEQEKTQTQSRIITYSLLAGLAFLILIGLILYRNNSQKQKANIVLQEQKKKIETTLQELKLAQQQLIQSEKMASLGELTAGIAHEIQNPLNFVNNFSEVNKEMLVELNEEIAKGNYEEATLISKDIIANEDKINYHGKRADAIVKGMLQHSRKSEGVKEPTDINALCDEYFHLAYQGVQAKNKNFTATLKTDFDGNVGNLDIIPEDIGRVLLNVNNNAFYAVSLLKPGGFGDAAPDKMPTVEMSTKKDGSKVLITITDNGPGIPQPIIDKIFQPFFTTKPTGSGTGLGLSLAYDIVKAHGGEINVNSKEGEGCRFVIQLPAG